MTLGEFEVGLEGRLARISKELMAGVYWPAPVRLVDIPKRSGGVRRLAIPAIRDRVVQTAAATVLTPILEAEFEDSSFGYRPGRSVRMAVTRVAMLRDQGYRWVVDGDIDSYFDRIPHDRLLERLAGVVEDERVVDLVSRWLDAHAEIEEGIPQGSPISPLLANLYLDEVDERIEGKGVRLVRFADDFCLLCKSAGIAENALSRIADILEEMGLELDPEKTRIVSFEKGFRFLGHLFVRSLVLQSAEPEPATLELPPTDVLARAAALDEPEPKSPEGLMGDDAEDHAPGLRVLYVTEPGRVLSVRNQAFTVEEAEEELIAIPPDRVDRIEIGPGSGLDMAALRHALGEAVPVAFLDGHGATLGTLEPAPQARAAVHLAQARTLLDPEARLDLARLLVEGRLHNQRVLLRRLNRRRKLPEVARPAHDIGRLLRLLPKQPDIAGLMGVEGRAGALYWPALGCCLEHGWKLTHRKRQPPDNAVNLAISWLATMLSRDAAAIAARLGMHTGMGVLHAVQDGRHSLALDIIEEFRAPLVEGLAVYLFNNRILKDDMFSPHGDHGVRISSPGVKALIRGYEAWLDRAIENPATGTKMRWRRLVEHQLLAFRRHCESGGEERYKPYLMDH
ncbi:MAG: CRISPR-associated endonuclease Cas1 [Geminicoccaceae bacterium]